MTLDCLRVCLILEAELSGSVREATMMRMLGYCFARVRAV